MLLAEGLSGADFYVISTADLPELAPVAVRVLSRYRAVGICEWVRSKYGWIQSNARSKLLPKKDKMLAIIYMALGLKWIGEPGEWQPDALEWLENDCLFQDVVPFCEGEVGAVFGCSRGRWTEHLSAISCNICV